MNFVHPAPQTTISILQLFLVTINNNGIALAEEEHEKDCSFSFAH